MCRVDRYGFPRTGPKKAKKQFGYQTGDMVKEPMFHQAKNKVPIEVKLPYVQVAILIVQRHRA